MLLLTEKQVKWGAETLDDAFKADEVIKNKLAAGAVETVDGWVFGKTIGWINEVVSPYIPDEYKPEIQAALDDVIDGDDDYSEAIENAISILTDLISELEVGPFVASLISVVVELLKAGLNYLDDLK